MELITGVYCRQFINTYASQLCHHFVKCVFQNSSFFLTREFWAVSFCISEETEALGFAVESLVHDHELLGWFNANMIHAYWELMSLWNL